MSGNPHRASSGSAGSTGSRGHAENIKKVAVTRNEMNALFMELDQVIHCLIKLIYQYLSFITFMSSQSVHGELLGSMVVYF